MMCINTHIVRMFQMNVFKSAYNIGSSHDVVYKCYHDNIEKVFIL